MTSWNFPTTVCFLLLLGAQFGASEQRSAVYELVTNGCPSELPDPAPATAASETECALRCTLDSWCRLSVYKSAHKACYSLSGEALSVTKCESGVTAHPKLEKHSGTTTPNMEQTSSSEPPATTPPVWSTVKPDKTPTGASSSLSALSVVSSVLMWYDFRKGYSNLAGSAYTAAPMGAAEQNSVSGVRLTGSASSYIQVSTPNFFSNFRVGRSHSYFFKGTFNDSESCLSSFSSCSSGSTVSYLSTNSFGGVYARTYFVDGSDQFASVNSMTVIPKDGTQRTNSIGVSFDGADMKFVDQWYMNGTMHNTEAPIRNAGSPVSSHFYDCLRIGNCFGSGPANYSGWIQCWGFVNRTLAQSEFDSLRNLCNS